MDFTTRRTVVYTLIGPDRLASAVSLDTVSMQLAKMLGPLAGGLLLAHGGPSGSYAVLALLYAASLVFVLRLQGAVPGPTRGVSESVAQGLAVAVREVWKRPLVRGVLLVTVVMNVLVFPYQQMLPVFARDVFRVGPELLGLLLAADGLGALAGALAAPALVVLYLISLPVTGMSTEVFVMAATVPILALAVFALLYLLPGKEENRPGDRVTALFILMFLAVVLCDQAAAGNAYQGQPSPIGPLAAEKAGVKPAAGDAAVLEKGKKVFDTVCSVCHRFDSKVVGPPLNEVVPKYKGDVAKLKGFIRNPVKVNPALPAMPKPAIKEDEVDAVARYLLSKVKGGK